MLRGLEFEPWVAPVRHWRNRMDLACFVGYTRRREGRRLPGSVLDWLRNEGWIDAPDQPTSELDAAGRSFLPGGIDHLPIPLDSWSMFEDIFEVHSLLVDPELASPVPSYLAAAVRSFFAQGGRRCVVVPVEAPADLYLRSDTARRSLAIAALVPAHVGDVAAMEPDDRSAWRGIGLLHGLDDVATLCLPDLPWLVGQVPDWLDPIEAPDVARDGFFECSDRATPRPERVRRPPIAVSRCDELEYRAWAGVVRHVSRFLAHHRRDLQFVAALPLPSANSRLSREPVEALIAWGLLEQGDEGRGSPSDSGVANRFLQLAYPWLGWTGAQGLPEGVEPADGALAGCIARATLLSGAFRTVAGRALYDIDRIEPQLSRVQLDAEPLGVLATGAPVHGAWVHRASIISPAARGFVVESDVTSSGEHSYQLASIQRMHAVWIRALKQAGESFVFEASNENTWSRVRRQLDLVGRALFDGGAFRGESPWQAYRIRCDRTTMSQRDIDAGRLIAEIEYKPAAPLETIRIALALAQNRRVSVVGESAGLDAANEEFAS